MEKITRQNKLHKLIFLLLIATLLCVTLVSCGDEPEELFIVKSTVISTPTLGETYTTTISAINGAPTNQQIPHGKFKSGTNVEISVNILNPSRNHDYNITFKNGDVKLTTIKYPDQRYTIVGLKNNYNIRVEITPTLKEDSGESGGGVIQKNFCDVTIQNMYNDQILSTRERPDQLGYIDIVADTLSSIYQNYTYRFDYWELIQAGTKNQNLIADTDKFNSKISININEDSNPNIVIAAHYEKIYETKFSSNAKILSVYRKNNVKVESFSENIISSGDSTITGYFADGDRVKLKFNPEGNSSFVRFNGWYKDINQERQLVSTKQEYEMLITKNPSSNIYLADMVEQTYVEVGNGKREYVDKGKDIIIDNIPDDERVSAVYMNGTPVTFSEKFIDYEYCINLGPTNENKVEIIFETIRGVTVKKYGFNGIGSFEISKVGIDVPLDVKANSNDVTGIKLNGVYKDKLTEYSFSAQDIKDAYLYNKSLIEIEACYTPYYTNYNGKITDSVNVDEEKTSKAFDSNTININYIKMGSYLPGLYENQSVQIEGIVRNEKSSHFILAGNVITNHRNNSLVDDLHRNDLLFVMNDVKTSTSENRNIISTLMLTYKNGDAFKKHISSIAILNNKLLISTYDDNMIYAVSLNALENAPEVDYIIVEEFLPVSFTYVTSLTTSATNGSLFVGGKFKYDNNSGIGPISNGSSFIGEYYINNKIGNNQQLEYHKSGVNNNQFTVNGYVPNNIYRMANKVDDSGYEKIVDGIGVNSNGDLILIFNPDDTIDENYLQNNEYSELITVKLQGTTREKAEYLGINVDYVDLTRETTYTKFKLPPLMKDVYVDKSAGGTVNFVGISSSFTRHILPSDADQCHSPVSSIIKIDNIKVF